MSTTYDLVIIGGGPAGVGAGVYAARKRLNTLFITKDFLGQSSVSEGIENWIGTPKISGLDLAKSLEAHLRGYESDILTIRTGELCSDITKSGSAFTITTDKQTYTAKTVLITTGSFRRKLEIPGAVEFDNKGLTYCASCDGPLFADQDVVVVGGGNAAFESAAQLLAYCKSVTILNRSTTLRADEVTVAKVLANPKAKLVSNAVPVEVTGSKFVNGIVYEDASTKARTTLSITGIFVEIGLLPNTYFVKNIAKLDQWNHIIVDPRTQRASTDGVWAAGDCTDGLYHQNNIAVGDAIKALEDIYLYIHKQ